MAATVVGTSLAFGGLTSNLIVYLIQEFNIKSISAAEIFNVVNGCITIFPIAGAIVADSCLGCYSVIWISSLISSLVSNVSSFVLIPYVFLIFFVVLFILILARIGACFAGHVDNSYDSSTQ